MTVCIFVGPTLRPQDIREHCEAVCLPPAAQGDVYRAARFAPKAIGIIDGYFSGAPSVWHKEILWAMSQGIPVFGCSSMGALRAAELHGFGMRGVGRIFEAFRDGVLEDDDEVAVAHGPAETGFVPVSEPMVNIRATLHKAVTETVVTEASRDQIAHVAKAQFFPHRTWPTILNEAGRSGVSPDEIATISDWLPQGRVDQKGADALAMLRAIQDELAQPTPRPRVGFESTSLWEKFASQADRDDLPIESRWVLDELRLQGPENYAPVATRALLRKLAGLEARRRDIEPASEEVDAVLRRVRTELGLFTRATLNEWLQQHDLKAPRFDRLVREESRLEVMTDVLSKEIRHDLLDELRLNATYAQLAKRAQQKQTVLSGAGVRMDELGLDSAGVMERRVWFFQTCFRMSPPDDLAAWVRRAGFDGLSEFDIVVASEWHFRRFATSLAPSDRVLGSVDRT